MRSHHLRRARRSLITLGVLTFFMVAIPHVALAQQSPISNPTRDDGGWVYWMAYGAIALGGLVVVLAGSAYLRFAPRFYRADREEEAKRTAVLAPPPGSVRIQYQPPPEAVAAQAPAAVASGAIAASAPAPVAAPAQAAAAPAPAAPGAAAPPPAPTAASAAPSPAPPRQEGPVELDQETFDRVLKEQLDKGTDRRVAEGRARSAALKAAREKAGG